MHLSRRIVLSVVAFATVFTGQSVLSATSAFALEPVIASGFSSVSVANRGVVSSAPESVAGANKIHVCGVTSAGGLKCWGDGDGHTFGDGTVNDHPIAFPVSASGVAQVESARTFTCARLTDKTVNCWGDGSQFGSLVPTPVKLNSTTALSGVTEISVGSVHACAVISGGGVKCWGNNVVRQIGDGTAIGDSGTDVRRYPTSVLDPDDPTHRVLTGVVDISSAGGNTCARKVSGAVVCWGDNSAGQLGNGLTSAQGFPVNVSGIVSAQQISTGRQHSCAVLTSGQLWCWGENTQAQLGSSSATVGVNVPSPVLVLPAGVKQVSAGSIHTCAVMVSGRAKCWGANLDYYRSVFPEPHTYFPTGQLGNGRLDGNYEFTPVDVVLPGGSPLDGVLQISAGYDESCAVLITGGVKCWGDNEHGQLGNNSFTNSAFPVDVLEASVVVPPTVPGRMVAPVATAGNGQASVAFVPPPATNSPVTGYTVTASPGGQIATGSTSPIVMNGLTNGVAYTFTVTATNSAGTSPPSPASAAVTPIAPVVLGSSPLFVPLAKPDRLLDNRNGPVGTSAKVAVNNPQDGTLLTVTVVDQASEGFVTVWPCDTTMPNTSNVNYSVGPAIPNTVNITPAADGTVCVFSSTPIHVIIDQTGSWSKVSGFAGQVPDRLLDTRDLGPQTTKAVASGFDPSKAALVNVTVVDASGQGFVTVSPCLSGLPETSNLNFVGGETRAAAAIVKPDANGQVCVFSSVRAHLLLDRMGTLPLARVDTSHVGRIIDTRNSGGLLPAGSTTLVPAKSSAVFVNVTVVDASADGYLTVYGDKAASRPDTSNVNYSASNASSNTALVPANNAIVVYASTGWKAIIDIQAEII